MKTKRLLLIGFILMLLISIGSFVFLNSVSPTAGDSSPEQQVRPHLEDKEVIVLPDVQLIQRFLESGKQMLRYF